MARRIHITLSNFVTSPLEAAATACPCTQNTFFKLEYASDEAISRNATIRTLDIQVLLKTKRERRVYQAGSRSKYIASTDALDTLGIHTVSRFSRAFERGALCFGNPPAAEASTPIAARFGPRRGLPGLGCTKLGSNMVRFMYMYVSIVV